MTLFTKLPAWVYAVAFVVGLALMAMVERAHYGASEYDRGRRSVTASVRVDTVTVNTIRRADSTAKAATDTIVQRLTVTRWKVDTLIRQVPPDVAALPEVKALIAATLTLTAQVDTLTRTLDVERAVSRLRASADSAALVSATVVIAAKEDEIVKLKRRPQWRTVFTVGALGVVAGLLR